MHTYLPLGCLVRNCWCVHNLQIGISALRDFHRVIDASSYIAEVLGVFKSCICETLKVLLSIQIRKSVTDFNWWWLCPCLVNTRSNTKMGPCWNIPGLKVCIGGERGAGKGASSFPLEEAAGGAGNRQIVFLGQWEATDGAGSLSQAACKAGWWRGSLDASDPGTPLSYPDW